MKKKLLTLACLFFSALLLVAPAWAATDYRAMSNEELANMRGAMQNATAEERNAFRNEWQKRLEKMPAAERSRFGGPPESAGGPGSGIEPGTVRNQNRSRERDDYGNGDPGGRGMSGGGGMGRGGMGGGNGMGGGRR